MMGRTIRAPRGTQLTCKNWLIEAAYRMIQNNLDPQVAGDPDNLIVYGGRGKAATNWDCFDAILEALRNLEPDETLLVQSGKPVAVFTTHQDAPRVLLANSNIVPAWATQENFDRWENEGLIMFGQMTAGSWIYIGTQGILQGTYETLGALARQRGWPSLKGKLVLTGGLGEMGGAQPLAITMNEGVGLIVEVDRHVQAMLEFQARGSQVFDYGNNLRQRAYDAGVEDAFAYPGFVPAYIRPLFCDGKGPFRWVALSGNPQDLYTTDQAILELFPEDEHLARWIRLAQEKVVFQGLPARVCWLGYGQRARAGLRFNQMVASGQVSAPIVIGRDHLDSGSVASPNRETESMADGSDAIADWPLLNALINAVSGATWVTIHHGGGVGIGYSIHAGQVIVADGAPAAAERLQRLLTNDPGLGVARHADAGYPQATDFAAEHGVAIPMLGQMETKR